MHLKLHIIALSLITLLLTATYFLKGDKPAEVASQQQEGYFIEVSSASFGLNCLDKKGNIDSRYIEEGENIYKSDGTAALRPNNALLTISQRCNGMKSCNFSVSASDLGIETAAGCNKELSIEYRCFSYDRPWSVKATEGDKISIDCSDRKVRQPQG